MLRTAPVALASMLALLGSTAGQDGKEGKKATYYYPTTVGTKLVFDSTHSNGAKSTITLLVKNVIAVKGGFRVTALRIVGNGSAINTVTEVASRGVLLIGSHDREHPEPELILKLPAIAGDSWPAPKMEGVVDAIHTVGKEVEIEVPAGKFKAIPVTTTLDGRKGAGTTTWYAPGLGSIKTVVNLGDAEHVIVLKSVEMAK